MRTAPATFRDHARDGSEFIYVVDVYPRGSDSWSQYRWAEKAITIGGNVYTAGIIRDVDAIRYRARIRQGGGIATRDAVGIRLNNKNRLDREFQTVNIAGRDVSIHLAMMPTNEVSNSGFETPTSGNDFTHWAETPGHGTNSITRETTIKHEGAQSAKIVCVTASPAPVLSTSTAVPIRNGTTVSLSFYARAVAASDVLRVFVRLGAYYWNNGTRVWQAGASSVDFSPSSSAFERFTIENIFDQAVIIPDGTTQDITLNFQVPNAGDGIYLDAVQLEKRIKASPYHAGRHDMTTADLFGLYWGELEAPRWNRTTISLKTKSIMNRRHRTIPTTIISAATTDSDFTIPPDNIGKPFPMTFGNFEEDGHIFDNEHPVTAAAAGIMANESARIDPITVYFDRPGQDMKQMTRIYHYAAGMNRFVREMIDTDSGNASEWVMTATEARIQSASGADSPPRGMIALSLMLFYKFSTAVLWTNPMNACDRDPATKTNATESVIATLVYNADIEKPQEFSRASLLAAYALGKHEGVTLGGTGVTKEIELAIFKELSGPTFLKAIYPGAGASYVNIPSAAHQHANEKGAPFTLSDPFLEIGPWLDQARPVSVHCEIKAGTSPSVRWDLYAIGVRLDCEIEFADAVVCCSMQGRTFADTWDGRKTSANLVDTAPEIIEAILRQELGIPGSDIDTAAFDAALSGRGSKACGQVTSLKPSPEAIEEIAAPFLMLFYVDGAGKESIALLDHGAPARTLVKRDLADKPEVEFSETSRDEVITDYILHYGYVPYADVFTRNVQCNRSFQNIGSSAYSTKCAEAYTALGDVDVFKAFYCPWINSETTAIQVLKYLIDWNRSTRRTTKVTGYSDLLDLEFGDRIGLALEEWLAESNTDAVRPVFVPESITINRNRVELELLEVIAP